MQRQLYLGLLFMLMLHAVSTEESKRKGDGKKSMKNDLKDMRGDSMKDDLVEDESAIFSTYADNRYSAFDYGATTGAPRTTRGRTAVTPPLMVLDDPDDNAERSRFMMASTAASNPGCASVVDMNHPLFADACGALPQARYQLPNILGHRERWQIELFLHGMISASEDATCLRSLRMLLCPLLFPSCPSRSDSSSSTLLPCQSFCRAVKTQCAIPALDFLPCDALPVSSDLCPTNQIYGVLFAAGQTGPNPTTRTNPYLSPMMTVQDMQAPASWNNFMSGSYPMDQQQGAIPMEYLSMSMPSGQGSMGKQGVMGASTGETRRTSGRV